MIDCHVHLEKGPYTVQWLGEFIEQAIKMNIDEIYFLEHTHIFKECSNLYFEMSEYNQYQNDWFAQKRQNARPIIDYINFIEKMKKISFPVKVKFGLEVCYSPRHEKDIESIKNIYPFDFLVGSVHWIDGWAFSHLKQPWTAQQVDVDKLYARYYQLMKQLAQSGLFSGLAHPNSLGCFGVNPGGTFNGTYIELARLLKSNNMYVEQSSGIKIYYSKNNQLGMNNEMLKIMKDNDVQILTASDAHTPQFAGCYIKELNDLIKSA